MLLHKIKTMNFKDILTIVFIINFLIIAAYTYKIDYSNHTSHLIEKKNHDLGIRDGGTRDLK